MQTLKFLAAALVATTMAGAAYAGPSSITQTGVVANQTTDFSNVGFVVTGGVNATTFAGFNAALGTLTGVSISYSVSGTETGVLTNASASSASFTFNSNSNIYVTDGGGTPADLLSYLGSGLTVSQPSTRYTLASGASTTLTPGNTNAFSNSPLSESTSFTGTIADEFIGTNFVLDLNTLSGYGFGGGGNNTSAKLVTQGGGDISIVYNYTPLAASVPEPATIAAFGAGLLGLTFVRLRKRA